MKWDHTNVLYRFKKCSLPPWPPDEEYKKQGAKVALTYGSICPWCLAKCKESEEINYIAICEDNPEHVVQWVRVSLLKDL